MRLIDADELEKELEKMIADYENRMPDWSSNDFLTSGKDAAYKWGRRADGVDDALEMVKYAPAIEAEPAKHGTWAAKKPSRMKWIPEEGDGISEEETTIEDMTEQKCSVCQRWAIKFTYHIEMNFCPNCGAKMDVKGERFEL